MDKLMELPSWVWPTLLGVMIWDGIWKAVAMWKAARSTHLIWYICIIIFNTVGLLPIAYLLFRRYAEKKENPVA